MAEASDHDRDRQMMEADRPRFGGRLRRGLSRRLVGAARDPHHAEEMTVGALVASLGDRSFGWCIVLFSLLALLPLPIGATMLTSIPLMLITGQMALGMRQVWLPGWILRRPLNRRGFQRRILWLGPLLRPVERIIRPRLPGLFFPRTEQLIGLVLLWVSMALFMPIPLSAYVPAIAMLVSGIGLVERDGVVLSVGVGLGILAILITIAASAAHFFGASLIV